MKATRVSKGIFPRPSPVQTLVKESQLTKTQVGRISKAERDERMDLTMMLTPVKTWMGGFTQPRPLRVSNWFSGGRYLSLGKRFEQPSEAAYEPHTVFLLESRYDIKFGLGRTECKDHIVGLCRSADFEAVLKRFNSPRTPYDALESMDNARWPWEPQKKIYSLSARSRRSLADDLSKQSENKEPILSPVTDNYLAKPSRERPERPEDKLRQTAAVAHRVREDNLQGLSSEMRRPDGKIPFELEHPDGSVYHPSGFKVPTSAADFAKYPVPPPEGVDPRTPVPSNPDAAIHHEQWKAVQEKQGHLMPRLTENLVTGDIHAHTKPRDEKIPTEVSGIMDHGKEQPPQHPSGFIPPTPAMARGETEALTHTVVSEDLSKDEIQALEDYRNEVREKRVKYFQHIENEPFWRPLIALNVSTRPIGTTLSRLSRGLSRGLPYHAIVESDGRKSLASFGNRMRCLRLDRMQELTVELAKVLAGARGGPIGIRFDMNQLGRGIDGENLAEPVPWEKRTIGVAVGNWYARADEIKESYHMAQADVQQYDATPDKDPFLIYDIDECGAPAPAEMRDSLPWLSGELSEIDPEIQPVVDELNDLFHMLDKEEDKELSVLIPRMMPKRDEEDVVVFGPVSRLRPSDKAPPGHMLLRGSMARNHIKERIEQLHEIHREPLARAQALRLRAVTYP
ncbi:hypothetical protein BDZ89DRAFT_1057264 [Hymenopellis radicata]|nr:hypothetical protein BDZ89DRAFT_1057264 [Hymenopellis radicata]